MEDDFELDVMRRISIGQAMIRKLEGTEPVAKGPICVFVDESGSMTEYMAGGGSKIESAKAIALALVYIARAQRRHVKLVSFASANEVFEVDVPPGDKDHDKLIDWLVHFYNGGTDPNAFVQKIPMKWEFPPRVADMIVITDGIMTVQPHQKEFFLKFKQDFKVRLQTVFVGSAGFNLGPLEEISDGIAAVPSLDLNQEIIRDILSL